MDVDADIPNIVANFLYQKMIAVRNVQWDTLRRMENAENGDGPRRRRPARRQASAASGFWRSALSGWLFPKKKFASI